MKNKVLKKALAAALAFTLIGGGLPSSIGKTSVFENAIVANAEGVMKTPAVGVIYHWGDIVKIGNDDIYLKIKDAPNQGGYHIYKDRPDNYYTFKLNQLFEYNDEICWSITCSGGDYFQIPVGYTKFDIPSGVKIVGGAGTESNPYKLSLVYENVDYNKVIVGGASISIADSTTVNFYTSLPDLYSGYDFYATQLDQKVSIAFYGYVDGYYVDEDDAEDVITNSPPETGLE